MKQYVIKYIHVSNVEAMEFQELTILVINILPKSGFILPLIQAMH